MLERVAHAVDPRFLALFYIDFDHIEAPWQVAGSEAFEPGVRSAFDECLFGLVHGIQRADRGALAAGFYFDKKQELSIPRDDVHFAAAGASEVSRQYFAMVCAQPIRGHPFAEVADPRAILWFAVRRRQVAGRVEQPA